METLKHYPGNKNVSGLYQMIINLMPKHDVYIEGYLGSGAIMQRKKPANENFGIDIDAAVIEKHNYADPGGNFYFINSCFLSFINGPIPKFRKNVLIYLDPPYLKPRRDPKDIYNYPMTKEDHIVLLDYCSCSDHNIIISGYECDLYNEKLKQWNRKEINVSTHAGIAREIVWFNFQYPKDIHDYKFVGKNFTDRQRIKRKINRWVNKLQALPDVERNAILNAINVAK